MNRDKIGTHAMYINTPFSTLLYKCKNIFTIGGRGGSMIDENGDREWGVRDSPVGYLICTMSSVL